MNFSFQYKTCVESFALAGQELLVERLESLDATIDSLFEEYERTGRKELFEELCPYFGVPWPAGAALTRLLCREPELWQGREVLELGCGLALPALALSQRGASVTATDMHPDVPAFLERNRARNGITGPAYLAVDWKSRPDLLPAAAFVVGSDLVYSREQPRHLLAFLSGHQAWREAIFADPGRPYWESFLALVRAEGWHVREELTDGIFFARIGREADPTNQIGREADPSNQIGREADPSNQFSRA